MSTALPSSSRSGKEQPIEAILVDWVLKSGVEPIDALHVAAMLEMDGWTDSRAVQHGYADVFILARAVYANLAGHIHRAPRVNVELPPWYVRLYRLLREYLAGLAFAVPMLLSSLSVLTLEYSLWSFIGFSTEMATGIALGTFGSFMATGGFTQAIARRGLFYLSQNQFGLARRAAQQLLLVGTVAAMVEGALLTLLLLVVPVLPWSMVWVAGIYYAALSLAWLGTGLLYMLQRAQWILVLVAGGIGLVYLQVQFYGYDLMMRHHLVATSFVSVGAITSALVYMFLLERRYGEGTVTGVVLPRWSQVSRSVAPYFLYGILYFAMLFVDRLMAWSVPSEHHPYFIWFMGQYELGMDWALWTLVLPIGIVEVYIHAMFRQISYQRQVVPIDQVPAFNRGFVRRHWLLSLLIFGTSLVSLILLIYLIRFLMSAGLMPIDPLADHATRFVFFVAAPAFGVVTVGLQNALVLFSLNEPWPMVRTAGLALLVNLAVGFLLSRYVAYYWAVMGFLAGAILFAFLSSHAALKALGRLDLYQMRTN